MYEAANVESSSEMSPGQMLLMGFAGMFTRLDADFSALLNATTAIHIADKYKKTDLVREASMLQVSVLLLKYELVSTVLLSSLCLDFVLIFGF